MLRKTKATVVKQSGGRFVIVASRYNAVYVNSMVRAAVTELRNSGASEIKVVRVPGAFEIPVAAARLARSTPAWDAVICLGVIIRGETAHADLIGRGVTDALVRLQVETGIPMIHEVLLLENKAQARMRCLDPQHNRGREAATTAVQMKQVMSSLGGVGR
ncbi:MAG: 6,7-dimethyl-8-ribityllumazine synthase [Verrucomicrobiae bacterium]|nr:6,7-dimethyl-8-ribityllumazine synthase [Verrucomicrobiae bacterium]